MNASVEQTSLRFPVLIGDIGGTNARFAILSRPDAEPQTFPTVQTVQYPTLEAAIQGAILDQTSARPVTAVLAIAGVMEGEETRLTNFDWAVRPRTLFSEVGLKELIILNDFEAQALAVMALGPDHLEPIGGGTAEPKAGCVVLGPGTGLGVAGLIHALDAWIPVPGEGGHMDIGPRTPREREIFPHLETLEGRISGEQILCGRGLVNVYRAISTANNVPTEISSPADVTARALDGSDPVAVEALDLFVTCLGRTAGDLALVFMSRGGVYLTGGIAQRIIPALKKGFRTAFEDKAPHRHILQAMPVSVITHPLAALAGLTAYARAPQRFGIETGHRRWKA